MNTEHKDIDKFIPFGEALRGFANQKFISAYELQSIEEFYKLKYCSTVVYMVPRA